MRLKVLEGDYAPPRNEGQRPMFPNARSRAPAESEDRKYPQHDGRVWQASHVLLQAFNP